MKICIVKLSAMGDIIHSMIALQFIKRKYPNSQIDWIVEENFKSILENNPHIDNILSVNIKSIKKNKFKIFNQIKILNNYSKNNYDIVIDAQGLLKSAIVAKIVGNKIVNSKIIGFDSYSIREKIASWFYDQKVTIGYEKNTIDRNIKVICDSLNIKVTKNNILNKKPFLFFDNKKILEDHNKILFVIGASKINKVYPKEKFLKLADKLNQNILVVWGNDIELKDANWLASKSKLIEVAQKGDLNDLKQNIKNAKLVIGADTGPTHMAWALNIPSITIFGNTPDYRNTYTTTINKTITSSSYVNPLKLDNSDFTIQDIRVIDIYNIAKELLK